MNLNVEGSSYMNPGKAWFTVVSQDQYWGALHDRQTLRITAPPKLQIGNALKTFYGTGFHDFIHKVLYGQPL